MHCPKSPQQREEAESMVHAAPARAGQPRQRGSLQGQVVVPDSFFDPLPSSELDLWGQEAAADLPSSLPLPPNQMNR